LRDFAEASKAVSNPELRAEAEEVAQANFQAMIGESSRSANGLTFSPRRPRFFSPEKQRTLYFGHVAPRIAPQKPSDNILNPKPKSRIAPHKPSHKILDTLTDPYFRNFGP
jgi:hypothetical protein